MTIVNRWLLTVPTIPAALPRRPKPTDSYIRHLDAAQHELCPDTMGR